MSDGVSWKILSPILLLIAGVLGWQTVTLANHGERISVGEANTRTSDGRLERIEQKVDRIWERLR